MRENHTKLKKIALIGISASLALLLSYIEFLLPPLFAAVPGIKIGLPNVVIMYLMYTVGLKYAAPVSFVRIAISSLLFGNVTTLAYSLAGAVLSLGVMILLKRLDKLSAVGVSVAGGVAHNIGQILVAMVLLDTPQIAYYLIVLALTGAVSGIFIGLCSALLIKRLPARKFLGL